MKRRAAVLLLAAAAVCGALAAGPAMAATGSAPAGHWGNARTVPGLKQLGSGREGELTVTSCPAAGTCAVFGNHSDASERQHAFHADETHGKWGKTVLVPGFTVQSGSCGGPGDCVAGGFDAAGKAATISEVSGTWSGPAPVPGIDALGGDAFLAAVSCGSPGNCAVIGEFDGARKLFAAAETNGIWGKAQPVTVPADLDPSGPILIDSLSCAPDGHCAAAGEYNVAAAGFAAFVVDGTNGTWGKVQQVPELSMLKAVDSEATSVSCASGGCAVGGWFSDGRNPGHAFIADEVNGAWGSPQEVPAVGVLEDGGGSQVNSISCGSAGSCVAAGITFGKAKRGGFVAGETNGTWQQSRALTGAGALSAVTDLEPQSVSCGRAGNCVTGGQSHTSSADQAFVASEVNGSWHKAREVPGSAALNKGNFAEVESVSCAAPGDCAAGGWYSINNNDDVLPFTADESAVTGTRLGLSATTVKFGHEQGEKISVEVSARTGGTPSGKVAVTGGPAGICRVTLAGGKGSCKLTARALKPGRYQLTARYGGDASYAGSASAPTALTVTK